MAHVKVAKWYHNEFKGKGRISSKNSGSYFEPNSTSEADQITTQHNYDFSLGWFGGPGTDGDYPQSVKDTLGELLPALNDTEKGLIKGSCDFYAIDGYTSYYADEVTGGGSEIALLTRLMTLISPNVLGAHPRLQMDSPLGQQLTKGPRGCTTHLSESAAF